MAYGVFAPAFVPRVVMQEHYIPPKAAFDPIELAVMQKALVCRLGHD